MTLEVFSDLVRSIRSAVGGRTDIDQMDIARAVDQALISFERRSRFSHINRDTRTFDTVAGQTEYQIGEGLGSILGESFVAPKYMYTNNDDGVQEEIPVVFQRILDLRDMTQYEDAAVFASFWNRVLTLKPAPDSVYTVTVRSYVRSPQIERGALRWEFEEIFDILVVGGAWMLWQNYFVNDKKAQIWGDKFKRMIDEYDACLL